MSWGEGYDFVDDDDDDEEDGYSSSMMIDLDVLWNVAHGEHSLQARFATIAQDMGGFQVTVLVMNDQARGDLLAALDIAARMTGRLAFRTMRDAVQVTT